MTSPTDHPTPTDRPLIWLLHGTLLAVALVMQTAACGSIDDDDESPAATATYQLESRHHACAGASGLTGVTLLERIDTPYTIPVSFPESDRQSTARFRIAYEEGAITCIPGHRGGSSRLEMEVELTLRTDDGALGETVPGTISVLAGSEQVRFLGSTDRHAATPAHIDKLMLEGWLTTDADDSQGALRLITSRGESPEFHTVASWNTTGE